MPGWVKGLLIAAGAAIVGWLLLRPRGTPLLGRGGGIVSPDSALGNVLCQAGLMYASGGSSGVNAGSATICNQAGKALEPIVHQGVQTGADLIDASGDATESVLRGVGSSVGTVVSVPGRIVGGYVDVWENVGHGAKTVATDIYEGIKGLF